MKNRIIKLFKLSLLIAVVFIFCINIAQAASISQGFNTTNDIPVGSLVSSAETDTNLVLTTLENSPTLVGVVINPGDYLVNLDARKQVQVLSSGLASTLVSDINGEIKSGDLLSPSPIAGVAMKATSSGKILGIAQEDFRTSGSQVKLVTDKFGRRKQIRINTLLVEVDIVNTKFMAGSNSAFVSGLQAIASTASGRQVSALRAVLAFVVLLLALALSIIVLYSSVSSSIRSIGRNPLSKRFVIQGLMQVIIAVFIIMIAAFSVVYIIIGS